MNNKKYFITFEGIDGCGKDTQLNKLVEQIREDDNYPFGDKYSTLWVTREPTKLFEEGRQISKKIREGSVTKEEATNLYVADRIKHSRLIEEMLNHSHVLCSRYDLSTLSYQMTQGMSFDDLYQRHRYGEEDGSLIPDITLVFTLPEKEANNRLSSRNGVEEIFEKRDFQKELEDNLIYCVEQLEKKGRKLIMINANQPIEDVTQEMFNKLANYINSQK